MRTNLPFALVVFAAGSLLACRSATTGSESLPTETHESAPPRPAAPTIEEERVTVPATISAGCRAYAAASCEHDAKCSFDVFSSVLGDISNCEQYVGVRCALSESLPGAVPVPLSCGADLARLRCGEERAVPSCSPPGTLPEGVACNEGSQCQSLHCDNHVSVTCGVCAKPSIAPAPPPSSQGSLCDAKTPCSDGFRCLRGVCRSIYLGPDDECSFVDHCAEGKACFSGTCVEPLGLGAECTTVPEDPCDAAQHLRCDTGADPHSRGTCRPTKTLPAVGDPCSGGYGSCVGTATCELEDRGHVCVAKANDGEECAGAGAHRRCAGPFSQCVDGTCTPVGPILCK